MELRQKKESRKTAFTLAEVLVVVVILGIAGAVIIPMISDSTGLQASSAARQIVSALLFAQTASIAHQEQYQVVFDAAAESYEIQDSSGAVIDSPVSPGTDYRISFPDIPQMKSVMIDVVDFDGTDRVWFDRLGAPYSGAIDAKTPLGSGKVTVRAGSSSYTVSVEPVSGRIKVEE